MIGLILCAGYGTRLQPLTTVLPKPLAPVQQVDGHPVSILDLQVEALRQAGATSIWINVHHCRDKLIAHATAHPHIDGYVEEPELLGTGGPLIRLRQQYPDLDWQGGLLVANGDIVQAADLPGFVQAAKLFATSHGRAFALLARKYAPVDTLCFAEDGRLLGIRGFDRPHETEPGKQYATYSGIAWYSLDALQGMPSDPRSCFDIRTCWLSGRAGEETPLQGVVHLQSFAWRDLGTPSELYGYWSEQFCEQMAIVRDRPLVLAHSSAIRWELMPDNRFRLYSSAEKCCWVVDSSTIMAVDLSLL